MKRTAIVLALILALGSFAGTFDLGKRGTKMDRASGTYADSQVDTITYFREGPELGLTFWMNPRDSVDITSVILKRVFNGKELATIAGDTVISATISTGNTGTVLQGTVNLSPHADTLVFYVAYTDSGNGVTSAEVFYGIGKTY